MAGTAESDYSQANMALAAAHGLHQGMLVQAEGGDPLRGVEGRIYGVVRFRERGIGLKVERTDGITESIYSTTSRQYRWSPSDVPDLSTQSFGTERWGVSTVEDALRLLRSREHVELCLVEFPDKSTDCVAGYYLKCEDSEPRDEVATARGDDYVNDLGEALHGPFATEADVLAWIVQQLNLG